MKRSRGFGHDEPLEATSPRTTIVGGRPPDESASPPPVPTGIQRLLRLASVDEAFARELRARREEMGPVAEVELTVHERAVLRAIPEVQLADMIANLPPPAPCRRTFLRQSAASAVLLLGGAALASACDDSGSPPEDAAVEDVPERNDHLYYADGSAPDVPPANDGGTGG
ncbi:MAG: hypothetical protein HY906_11825 [Deltaproteobacteria bacterium]|nr:hypothetical protein [Deltaproteobacteria bacterium]